MKIIDIILYLNADELTFINDYTEDYEFIKTYVKGSHRVIRDYFDKIVVSITPNGDSLEIRYKE